jgi:hypothetical protein
MEAAARKDGQKHANEAGHMLKGGRQGCVDKETKQKKMKLLKLPPAITTLFILEITCESVKASANKLCFYIKTSCIPANTATCNGILQDANSDNEVQLA